MAEHSDGRGFSSGGSYAVKPAPPRALLLIGALTVFACIAALFAIVNLINAGAGNSGASVHDAAVKLEKAEMIEQAVTDLAPELESIVSARYTVESADILAIPGSNTLITLNLANGSSAPAGESAALSAVRRAVTEIEEQGDCGLVFVDMNTGEGLAYNADEVLYIASAAKAPFIYWLLTTGVELEEYDLENVMMTIEDSENDAFEMLYNQYYDEGYANMMAKYGVQHDDYYNDFYPPMSARSLAALWVDMLRYMQNGDEKANWFITLLGNTTTSFIRDALHNVDAVVVNKGGWISEEGYVSVTDAGVIQVGEDLYLMTIITGQPDEDMTEQNVTTLARALYDARDAMRS